MKGKSAGPALVLIPVLILAGTGCEKAKKSAESMPPGNDPHSNAAPANAPFAGGMGGMKDAEGPTDGHEVALKAAGHNSAAELSRAVAKLSDPEAAHDYEMAFRYSFSAKQAQRNYPESERLAQKVLEKHADFAPAYRVLGYARFNMNMRDPDAAMTAYLKAIELDPNYGEAHYALAFMYAMGDRTQGLVHFKKATELGVEDERNLGERFYSEAH